MHIFDELQQCSFKGTSFLFINETTTAGKKTVSHEFPNSDERYTEELGKMPARFSIQALIYGTIDDRLNFENVLSSPGLGILVHPIYGKIEVMATNYTVTSNQTAIGEFIFNVNFETSRKGIQPSPAVLGNAKISSDYTNVKSSLGTAFTDKFKTPSSPNGLTSMADKIGDFMTKVQSTVSNKITNPIRTKLATYRRAADKINSSIWTIASNGTLIKDSISDLYTSIENLVQSPAELKSFWKDLTTFGNQFGNVPETVTNYTGTDEVSVSTVNTVGQQERVSNNAVFDEYVKLTALAGLNESYAYVEYQTDTELTAAIKTLEDKYKNQVRLAPTYVDSSSQMHLNDGSVSVLECLVKDTDVLNDFNTLRNDMKVILYNKYENTWKIATIQQKNISSIALTSYRYFGDDENKAILSALNPEVNASGFKTNIKMVTT